MAIVVFSLGSTIFPTSGSQLGLQHWTRILLYEVELKLENWWLYAGKSAVIAPSLLSLCDNNCCLWNWQLSRPTDYLSPAAAYTLDIGRTDSRQWGFQVSFGLTLPSPFFKLCGIFSNGVLPSNFFFLKKMFLRTDTWTHSFVHATLVLYLRTLPHPLVPWESCYIV